MVTKKTKTKKDLIEENLELAEENDNFEDIRTSYIETGNIGFDMALSNGKGLPVGSSILLWANPGCGKTTLTADISKRLIKTHKARGEEFKVLYLAVEGSRDLMIKMGLGSYMRSHDFIYIEKGLRWRDIETFFNAVLNGKGDYAGVKLIVIDSANNVLSDSNEEKSVADHEYGTRAQEKSKFFSKYLPKCKEAGVSVILISQVRQNLDAGLFGEKKKAAATDGDKHNVDIIIKCSQLLSHKDSVKEVTETAFGTDKIVERYIMLLDPTSSSCKNRYEITHKCELMIDKGKGIQNFYVLRKLLVYHGFMTEASGYYTFLSPLCELLEAEEGKKYRKDTVHDIIGKNTGKVVAFLKEHNCYSVIAPDRVKKVSGDEDTENNEEE